MADNLIEYTIASPELLTRVRELARLRYTVYQIAIMNEIPPEELRVRIADPADPFHTAYYSGVLLSQAKYREKVVKSAENGNQRSIKILENWECQQKEEELGGNV